MLGGRIDISSLFNIQNDSEFLIQSLAVFNYQYRNNAVYKEYCDRIKVNVATVDALEKIPFLPISFFKSHEVYTARKGDLIFTSSGTTRSITSKHFIADPAVYEESFMRCFTSFYGEIEGKCILGLLPSYLDRSGSSLVYMVNALIEKSQNEKSGFYLRNYAEFIEKVKQAKANNEEVVIFGVSYALWDLAEDLKPDLSECIVIETGGMKGQRPEIPKSALHQILKKGLNITDVHSEYGMTELLSQGYSKGNERFLTPPWMKILIREQSDPFQISSKRTGGINVIDLANVHSCSFIATEDLGKIEGHYFRIMGRFDTAEIRGCNLMYSEF